MKKAWLVVLLAVALTFVLVAPAFADHSPTFFVEWDGGSSFTGYSSSFGNAGTGSPHQNYLEGTEKCGVCHSVHRAPVPGVKWDTNPSDPASETAVAGGQYMRQEFESDTSVPTTQMLLTSTVANSCNYCHVLTSIGGAQLYGGKPQYITEGTGLAGAEWDAGFGHHNACTGCHAVHGVSSNFADPALFGTYGTFQGAAKTAILKVRAKGSGGAVGSAAAYNWQDETVAIGSSGAAEYAASGIAGAAAWVGLFDANANGAGQYSNYDGAVRPAGKWEVDPLNVPLFPSAADAINGTNVRPDADTMDAQVSVFCTFCHVNYGYASEATVNPDGDRGLFQGPWYANTAVVPNTSGGGWQTANGAGAYGMPFKNHPVKPVYGTFAAAGKSATVPGQVAFAGASTCRSCHDAGVEGVTGVIFESYPHFTPGYFHFAKGGAHVGAPDTYGPVENGLIPNYAASGDAAVAAAQAWLEDPASYEEAITVHDGQCLKCHVNATDDAGIGKTY
ncbi:MAG TPA: hypothetical protein VFG89_04000 [Coriobacteriia bacterium]|nr:hypothetical protein [Coriobacteriia bacterium]